MIGDYTHDAVSDRTAEVRMLLRLWTYEFSGRIPHLNDWVVMPENWDYLSGHSSVPTTVDAPAIAQEVAMVIKPIVPDPQDDAVERFRALQ